MSDGGGSPRAVAPLRRGWIGPHALLLSRPSGVAFFLTMSKRRLFQILRTVPDWSRNVQARRRAWDEVAARSLSDSSARSRAFLPPWVKVPPQRPPQWAHSAHTKHDTWQSAADRGAIPQDRYNTGYYGDAPPPQQPQEQQERQEASKFHLSQMKIR